MEIWQEAALIGLAIGVVIAFFVAPRSIAKEPIRGGTPAVIFHFIGSVLFSAVVPTVFAALILRGGFGVAFPLAIGMVVLAYIALLGFAVFEQPALAKHQPDEDVWTAEKAKTSGL